MTDQISSADAGISERLVRIAVAEATARAARAAWVAARAADAGTAKDTEAYKAAGAAVSAARDAWDAARAAVRDAYATSTDRP